MTYHDSSGEVILLESFGSQGKVAGFYRNETRFPGESDNTSAPESLTVDSRMLWKAFRAFIPWIYGVINVSSTKSSQF